MLGKAVGWNKRRFGKPLDKIQQFCLANEHPPLSILVVNKGTYEPGKGFTACRPDEYPAKRAEVHQQNWTQIGNPFLFAMNNGEQKDVLAGLLNPATARDFARMTKSRGSAQNSLRKLLLQPYATSCAFCGLGYAEALEAAHILPWSVAEDFERADPRNVLILCSTHHKLFDAHILTLSVDSKIQYQGTDDDLRECDSNRAIKDLHGQRLRPPSPSKYAPTAHFIHKRAVWLSEFRKREEQTAVENSQDPTPQTSES